MDWTQIIVTTLPLIAGLITLFIQNNSNKKDSDAKTLRAMKDINDRQDEKIAALNARYESIDTRLSDLEWQEEATKKKLDEIVENLKGFKEERLLRKQREDLKKAIINVSNKAISHQNIKNSEFLALLNLGKTAAVDVFDEVLNEGIENFNPAQFKNDIIAVFKVLKKSVSIEKLDCGNDCLEHIKVAVIYPEIEAMIHNLALLKEGRHNSTIKDIACETIENIIVRVSSEVRTLERIVEQQRLRK